MEAVGGRATRGRIVSGNAPASLIDSDACYGCRRFAGETKESLTSAENPSAVSRRQMKASSGRISAVDGGVIVVQFARPTRTEVSSVEGRLSGRLPPTGFAITDVISLGGYRFMAGQSLLTLFSSSFDNKNVTGSETRRRSDRDTRRPFKRLPRTLL